MTRLPRIAAVVLSAAAFAAVAPLGGCGYTTGSLVAERHHTIAVLPFGNETRRHDIEWELTQAVIEEIQSRTSLRVVPESDGPDLVLRGVLRDAEEETLSRRDHQRLREGVYFLTAEIDVTERGASVPLVKDRKVHERESYVPVVGEDVRTARAEATRALAERIVRQLEQTW